MSVAPTAGTRTGTVDAGARRAFAPPFRVPGVRSRVCVRHGSRVRRPRDGRDSSAEGRRVGFPDTIEGRRHPTPPLDTIRSHPARPSGDAADAADTDATRADSRDTETATDFDSVAARALVDGLRREHATGFAREVAFRRDQLARTIRLIEENESAFTEALRADMGKPDIETYAGEIAITLAELKAMRKHLARWAAPEPVSVPLASRPGKAWVQREAKGIVLVISPWNYPLQLSLLPVATAIAAGNAVVLKPSELAPATTRLLAETLPRYLDARVARVVEGAVPETTALLEQRWDHIFYTGNATVGRVVMRAAAEHLTPVTLELGGKSPAIVDRGARLEVAARRIVWGKFFNAGQTCVAPDHVLVHRDVHRELVAHMVEAVRAFYGKDPARSEDYGRIVNDRHFQRLTGLMDAGGFERVAIGGQRDAATRFIAPTLLDEVSLDAALMGEEIFGPLLPIVVVDDLDAAVGVVNAGPKPLALYVFTEDDDVVRRVVRETSAGGMCINHTILHLGVPDLPFGGVGESGMGAYHGKWGFEELSHRKSVLERPTSFDPPVAYPPFGKLKKRLVRAVL